VRFKSVALLPELAELGVHLVEGAVLVAGAVLELLPPANGNQEVSRREK
jgi:2-keto-4-pentenoate hydratase